MQDFVTRMTNRNDDTPVLLTITHVVVIVACLVAAIMADARAYGSKFTLLDGMIDGFSGSVSHGESLTRYLVLLLGCGNSFGGLIVPTECGSALLRSFIPATNDSPLRRCGISSGARFAVGIVSIAGTAVSIKLLQGLEFFACWALLGYNRLRHGQLLISCSCSEPDAGHNLCSARFILPHLFIMSRRISYGR